MMTKLPSDIAIVGAGLAGPALALSILHHFPTTVAPRLTIYESRSPDAPEIASGVVLTPNGLEVLEKLDVYKYIKDICWRSQYRTYKNDEDVTTRKTLIATEELYGFRNHRLYRRVLLQILKDVCQERGTKIKYETKFGGIVRDDENGVVFLANGQEVKADLLIGADGIYSSVRQYIAPGTLPEYTGTTGVLAHIKWDSVDWPYHDYDRACTIQGKPGAFFMIPELKDGSEVMVGTQAKFDDMSREEWALLAKDKDRLAKFFTKAYDQWTATPRKVIDAVVADGAQIEEGLGKSSLYMWPFMKMPKLDRWYSPSGNVIIVGDGAHAIPPSSGQGVNQALEDIWSLGRVLALTKTSRLETLAFWQQVRQQRVDAVFEWATGKTNVMRMGKAERDKLIAEGKIENPDKASNGGVGFDDMAFLYRCDTDSKIDAWLTCKSDK